MYRRGVIDRPSWLRRAQSTAEYATLFAIIVGAIVAMQLFVKRASQAKMKDAFTYFAGPNGLNIQGKLQYEPYYVYKNLQQTTNSYSKVNVMSDLAMTTTQNALVNYTDKSYEETRGENSINSSSF